jgi:hypothetical protein
VIGGESIRIESSAIATSALAATATTFAFSNPIYLLPGTEYCFAVKPDANSTDFEIWTAELGQIDISNPQVSVRIDKQPAAGVVFTSSNDFTWSVRQNQDIKFNMKVAMIATTPATVAPSLVGTWAYNTGDGTANTSCDWNGALRCGYYYTSTPGTYSMGPPR